VHFQGIVAFFVIGVIVTMAIYENTTSIREKSVVYLPETSLLENEERNHREKQIYGFGSSNTGSVYYRLPCEAFHRISEEKRRYFVSLREVHELDLNPSKSCP